MNDPPVLLIDVGPLHDPGNGSVLENVSFVRLDLDDVQDRGIFPRAFPVDIIRVILALLDDADLGRFAIVSRGCFALSRDATTLVTFAARTTKPGMQCLPTLCPFARLIWARWKCVFEHTCVRGVYDVRDERIVGGKLMKRGDSFRVLEFGDRWTVDWKGVVGEVGKGCCSIEAPLGLLCVLSIAPGREFKHYVDIIVHGHPTVIDTSLQTGFVLAQRRISEERIGFVREEMVFPIGSTILATAQEGRSLRLVPSIFTEGKKIIDTSAANMQDDDSYLSWVNACRKWCVRIETFVREHRTRMDKGFHYFLEPPSPIRSPISRNTTGTEVGGIMPNSQTIMSR